MATVGSQAVPQPDREAGRDRERSRTDADGEWARIEADPEYRELRALQRRFTIPATALYLVAYFGFLLLAGLAPGFLGTDVIGSINLGFLFMAALFVLVWALVRTYVEGRAGALGPARGEARRRPPRGGPGDGAGGGPRGRRTARAG